MSEPFIAEIRIFPFTFAPRGWAFCNGQVLPIAQNTALFSLIGTTYGGDGRTTLGLPNLMARAPMHPGRGPGLTQRRLGETGGTSTVTLTEAQVPAHSHALKANLIDLGDTSVPGTGVTFAQSAEVASTKHPPTPSSQQGHWPRRVPVRPTTTSSPT